MPNWKRLYSGQLITIHKKIYRVKKDSNADGESQACKKCAFAENCIVPLSIFNKKYAQGCVATLGFDRYLEFLREK